MPVNPSPPRAWVAPWLLGVAALHTLFGAVVFGPVLRQLWQGGVFNTVGADPLRGAVVWFLMFGVPLALLARAIAPLERQADAGPVLRQLGWGLLVLGLAGVALMPASGFWLTFPPAIGLLRRHA
ncbi:DUF6463 family protein [Ideonella sp. DXS29W]|uniref:DUF6463 family protein n=1 Tax=Ideonella lacteola TaxID=2984193 RepID=A0ABU9BLG7_9BURK